MNDSLESIAHREACSHVPCRVYRWEILPNLIGYFGTCKYCKSDYKISKETYEVEINEMR